MSRGKLSDSGLNVSEDKLSVILGSSKKDIVASYGSYLDCIVAMADSIVFVLL